MQQLVNLQINPICAGTGAVRLGKLTWDFTVQPDALSWVYAVRIEYRQGDVPLVWVLDPDLGEQAEGRRLPHVYEQNPARLCLYLPGTGEWSAAKRISETIVPWTYLWLWYFEEWLASGVWKGGCRHPPLPEKLSPRRMSEEERKCAVAR